MYIYIFTDDLLHHLETYFFELTYIYIWIHDYFTWILIYEYFIYMKQLASQFRTFLLLQGTSEFIKVTQ